VKKLPWRKFFPGDWLKDPALRMCSLAARGAWIDLVCAMHEGSDDGVLRGTVEGLSRICGCSPEEMESCLNELHDTGTANVTRNANVTAGNTSVTVICRRMQREAEQRLATKERVRRHRSNASVTGEKSEVRSQKSDNTPSSPPRGTAKKRAPGALHPEAEAVYQIYPRKVGKPPALRAITKALKKVEPEWLKERTRLYAESRAGEDPSYTPHPATWFHQERYADDPATWAVKGNGQHQLPIRGQDLGVMRRRVLAARDTVRQCADMRHSWELRHQGQTNPQLDKELDEAKRDLDRRRAELQRAGG